jgi:DNA (cytosine-5)-methyltransferase 1
MKKPKAIDLFCGAGGLTEGLKRAGFSVVGAIEMEPLAVRTYRANHRRVRVWDTDIARVQPEAAMRQLGLKRGDLDLLAGCPPCQGFSAMRTLNGGRRVRDPKTKDLVLSFLKFAKVFFPKVVMLENVPRLQKDRRLKELARELRDLGYEFTRSEIRDAQNYGVPQRRRRLIFLASRIGEISEPKIVNNKPTVGGAIRGLKKAGSSGDPVHDVPEKRQPRIIARIQKIPKDGGSRTDLPQEDQLACHKKCDGFKDVYGRMAWEDVAPTITGGCFNPSKGRFLHPEEDRCITLREAALLQSFPQDYRFPDVSKKQAVALMIGNALPPEFIRRHARKIKGALEAIRP